MTDRIAAEVKKLAIGKKIRTLRERHNLTLQALARSTEMPEVVLSQIESEVITPTVAALVNIASALGTQVDAFFQDTPFTDKIEVVRSGQGRRFRRVRGDAGTPLSYSYESLAYRLAGKHMEPFLVEFSLEADEAVSTVSHEGEEFLYVLEGEVEFVSGDERIVLQRGDSLYFYSKAPHSLKGVGVTTPKVLAVLYPYGE